MNLGGRSVDPKDLEAIKASVTQGVQQAIADPKTWEAGFTAMGDHLAAAAQAESGKWVIGWLGWIVKKAALGIAVVAVLYYTGGLPAVVAWLKVK
jgi:hypothetical protein